MANDFERLKDYISDARSRGLIRLPPEPRLSEELDVTRGRLRTLLRKVEDEGLIWRHVGKGTFVGPRDDATPAVAEALSVDQTIQARYSLEPQLAAQAAMHANASDIAELRRCLDAMSDTTSFEEWKQLDDQLHQLVAAATHNPLLVVLYATLKQGIAHHLNVRQEAFFGPLETSEARLITEREHQAFFEAIRTHDPSAAERLMQAHIQSVRSRLFGGR